jgi:EAL domain-containing protein (putative c-di-GMP-specific phosphodiesterase class I)
MTHPSSPVALLPARRDAEVADLLARGFFSMAFQPIVRTADGARSGFEALLRGPRGTALASPGTLFGRAPTVAPELLRQLDLACVEAALRSGRALPPGAKLFVNVQWGTMSLDGGTLFSLMDALEVDPKSLVLEISETIDGVHTRAISKCLAPFRRRGVQLALDDVGVRYPWLYHLLHLEPEYIKVDRAFVKGTHRAPRKAGLLLGLRDLAARAGAALLAEGIETPEDARALAALGIPLAQGFFYGSARPAEEWLAAGARESLWSKPLVAIHVPPDRD